MTHLAVTPARPRLPRAGFLLATLTATLGLGLGDGATVAARCSLGAPAVVKDVMVVEGTYRVSGFGGSLAGRPWSVCQYVSGSLTVDRPTSLVIGVFPTAGRVGDREWKLGACGQMFLTAVQAKPRACSLLHAGLSAKRPAQRIHLLGAALSQVGAVARTTVSGNPAYLYSPSTSPGSDAWVYLSRRGLLVHAHCTRASNPELRAGDCSWAAAQLVAGRLA